MVLSLLSVTASWKKAVEVLQAGECASMCPDPAATNRLVVGACMDEKCCGGGLH